MISNLINKLKRHKKQLENISDKKKTNIVLSKINNFYKMEIKDYISIVEYVEKMKQIDEYNLDSVIYNAVLWNSKKQCVNKGIFYVIVENDKTYNILIDEDIIEIDERIKNENTIDEKVITYDKSNEDYRYSSLKHYLNGDTFYTKFYTKNSSNLYAIELSKEQAHKDIQSVIDNLGNIENIETILEIDILKNILEDLKSKQIKKTI